MSKKDKSKFRRRLREQILKNIESQPVSLKQPNPQTVQTPSQTKNEVVVLNEAKTEDALSWVKKDLKKSAIIIGSVIILIVALFLLDKKFDFLQTGGSQLFKVLNISS